MNFLLLFFVFFTLFSCYCNATSYVSPGNSTTYAYMTGGSSYNVGANLFTVGLWFKTTATSGTLLGSYQYGSSTGSYWYIQITSATSISFTLNPYGYNSFTCTVSTTVNNGQWNYVAGIRDGAMSARLRINNITTTCSSSANYTTITTNYLYMGAYLNYYALPPSSPSSGSPFKGEIDDVRIWGYAMTDAQSDASADYMAIYSNNLIDYWSFDYTPPDFQWYSSTMDWVHPNQTAYQWQFSSGFSPSFTSDSPSLLIPCNPLCASPYGSCSYSTGNCVCNQGFSGTNCQTLVADPPYCTASGSGIAGATAGVAGPVSVQVNTYQGTAVAGNTVSGLWNVFVNSSLSTTKTFLSVNYDSSSNMYDTSYTLTIAGTYSLFIYLENTAIKNCCPFIITVSAGPVSPVNCTITGVAGYINPPVGFPAGTNYFIVTSYDRFGNRRPGGDVFTLTASGGINGIDIDLLNGNHQMNLTLTAVGSYYVNVSILGVLVPNSPMKFYVVAGQVSNSLSTIVMPSPSTYVAGAVQTLTITAYDVYGNSELSGTLQFVATISGGNSYIFYSTYFQNNQYTISYYVTRTATSYISITSSFTGTMTFGSSPYTVNCVPAALSAAQSTVQGPLSPMVSGALFTFTITAMDMYSNQRFVALDASNFTVNLVGPSATYNASSIVYSSSLGAFVVSITAYLGGTYTYYCYGPQNIQLLASPFPGIIVTSGTLSAQNTIAYGPAISQIFPIYSPNAVFYVQGRDPYGNNVSFTTTPTYTASVVINGTFTSAGSVSLGALIGTGLKINNLNTVTVGYLQLYIQISGTNIKGSPFLITSTFSAISNTQSSLSPIYNINANASFIFNFTAKDSYGNPITSGLTFLASISPNNNFVLTSTIQYQPGVYTFLETPTIYLGTNTEYSFNFYYSQNNGSQIQFGSTIQFWVFGPPTLSSFSPVLAPTAGGTPVNVLGNNFISDPSLCVCIFGGVIVPMSEFISPGSIICVTPTGMSAGTVSFSISTNHNITNYGNGATFLFYTQISNPNTNVTSAPAQGGTPVTITGSNFLNVPTLSCNFGSVPANATVFVSSTSIICYTPSTTFGTVSLTVSNNAIDFVPVTSFVFVENASPDCRTTGEVSVGVTVRENSGQSYFPNLALSTNVTLTDNGVAPETNKASLVDGDRCCYYTLSTLGYQCGILFQQQTPPNDIRTIEVILPRPAWINEALFSIYQPCQNEPPFYTVSYFNGTSWVVVVDHVITGTGFTSPCSTIPSDVNTVALCIDYFAPVISSQFRLQFNNSIASMGAGNTGWSFEFEVHGIYLMSAYELIANWTSLYVEPISAASVSIPSVTISTNNVLGQPLSSGDIYASHSFQVSLYTSFDGGVTFVADTTGMLQGTTSFTISASSQSISLFNNLSLVSPASGYYQLLFSSTDPSPAWNLLSATLPFNVGIGNPVQLQLITASSSTLQASSTTIFLPITVQAYDIKGEFIGISQSSAISIYANLSSVSNGLSMNNVSFGGTTMVSMTNGVATFSNLYLSSPIVGTYTFDIYSVGLSLVQTQIVITPGAAVSLRITFPSSASVTLNCYQSVSLGTVTLNSLDVASNFVPTDTRQVSVSSTTLTLTGTLIGTISNGAVSLSNIFVNAPVQGPHIISLTAVGLSGVNLNVDILPGTASILGVIQPPPPTQTITLFADSLILPIGNISIVAEDAGENVITNFDTTVTASLFLGSTTTPALILSGTIVESASAGVTNFNDLVLVTPPAGSYTLRFSASTLFAANLAVVVEIGLAYSLVVSSPTSSTVIPATATIYLPVIIVETVDICGNPLGGLDSTRTIIASALASSSVLPSQQYSFPLQGTTSVSNNGDGVATFVSLSMNLAPTGLFEVVFSTTGINNCSYSFQIVLGPAYQLSVSFITPLQGLATSVPAIVPAISIRVLDSAGSVLGSSDSVTRSLSVSLMPFTCNGTYVGSTGLSLSQGSLSVSSGTLKINAPVAGSACIISFATFGLVSGYLNIPIIPGAPYSIHLADYSQSEWSNEIIMTAPSVILPTIGISVLDAGGGPVNSNYLASQYVLTISVANNATLSPLSVLGTPTIVMSELEANFTNAIIRQPSLGNYQAKIVSTTIPIPLVIYFTVIQGAAASLTVTLTPTGIPTLSSTVLTSLPIINVFAVDAAGNLVGASDPLDRNISVSMINYPQFLADGTTPLTPAYAATIYYDQTIDFLMHNGAVTISSGSLSLHTPVAGTYSFQAADSSSYASNLLLSSTWASSFTVVVAAGPIATLFFSTLPPTTHTAIANPDFLFHPPLSVSARDAANNVVLNSTQALTIAVSPSIGPISSQSFIVSGIATFPDFSLEGIPTQTYALTFYVVNQQSVNITTDISIVSCSTELANSIGSGDTCVCAPGYFQDETDGQCTACPLGTFKLDASDASSCQACSNDGLETTLSVGKISQSDCLCKSGYFLNPKTNKCVVCPQGAKCLLGEPIQTLSGWYLCTPSSFEYCRCPEPSACPAGVSASTVGAGQCATGYTGPLCGVCISGYGGLGNLCQKCPNPGLNWLILVAILIVFGVLLYFFLKSSTDITKSQNIYSLQATMALKIAFNYAQQLAFLSGFDVPWPSSVSNMFSGTNALTFAGKILAISCAVSWDFYTLTMMYMLGPFIVIFFVYILLKIYEIYATGHKSQEEKKQLKENTRSYSVAFAVAVVFMSHPNVTRQVLETFNCIPVGRNKSGQMDYVLADDMSEYCNTQKHVLWQAISVLYLVIYSAGVLLIGIAILDRVKDKLNDKDIFVRYSLLYQGFRKSSSAWEIFILMRKMALVCIVVFGRSKPIFQNLCGQLLFFLAIILQLYRQPHVYEIHHRLELLTLFVTYFTITTGGLYGNSSANDPLTIGIGILVVVFCTLTFAACFLVVMVAVTPLIFPELRAAADMIASKHKQGKDQANNKQSSPSSTAVGATTSTD